MFILSRLRPILRPFHTTLALPLLAACMVAHDGAPVATPGAAPPEVPPPGDGETLLLQEPTVSAGHVVFRYADDLWIVGREGGRARRLTSSLGLESSPQLSPDGTKVAFSGQYEGNTDVYVISIDGGVPQRLTWHPGPDQVLDWYPDGSGVLFGSRRETAGRAPGKVWLASLAGGPPTALALPKAAHVSINAAATHLAYTPFGDAFRTWKRYRGGRIPPVWIFDRATHEVEEVPHVKASDTFPCWVGSDVYFASDRDRVMNLYRYSPGGGEVEQLTHYTDFHIRNMDAGAGVVAFEQAGRIHLFDPATSAVETMSIQVPTDGLFAVPRWQPVEGHVRGAHIAPNGKRAVFEARGEIITVPRENGDARNLTNSPGVHERSPAWSPDGESIAWLSDEGGEYHLVVQDRLGRGEARTFELGGAPFYWDLEWSPDGEHILFCDKGNRVAFVTLETGEVTDVVSVQGSLGELRPEAVWSPDSKWIAYVDRDPRTLYDSVALYELASSTHTPVTDDFAMANEPAFSRDGKYLFFHATVECGPALMGLNMATSAAREWDGNLYVAVLKADEENPLAPKSDDAVEEDDDADGKKGKKDEDEDEDSEEAEGEESPAEEDVVPETESESTENDAAEESAAAAEEEDEGPSIDIANLDQRILALPVPSGRYRNLGCTEKALLYVEGSGRRSSELKSFDFDSREAKSLKSGVRGFLVSGDGKNLLTMAGGGWSITNAKASDGKSLAIDSVRVRVEPEVEWPQILREVWRIERDYFYDANMHGVDWPAMWERWSAFLPHVQHRNDLTVLIQELIGELCCGHEYVGGGETPDRPSGISVGLLGADLAVADGKWRFARILRGQNWNPDLRSPLTEPGVDAREGDYLLAVNGRPLDGGMNLFRAFEYTDGKQVELTLSATPDGAESRTVTVVPLRSDGSLRFLTWIEDNRRRVDELSDGRLAYAYMPNTGGQGMAFFDRDFYSQLHKQGLVLDERYNGGGQVADYVIETLDRQLLSLWRNREQWLGYSPSGVMPGPKVMVINEHAGSGGDWMPWAFQKQGIGPLVGTRTWGGLVGISGYPPLMDGGSVTAASFGVMDVDGEWAVENVGVSPDVEVIEWPKEILAGRDPQLEKAVELALEELERNPPPAPPAFHPPAVR